MHITKNSNVMSKTGLNVQIPKETLEQIQQKVKELRELLTPFLVNLTIEDRSKLAKMSDKTLPFVSKTIEYVSSNANLIPPMMKADELVNDFELNQSLQPLHNHLKQLTDNLSDTLVLSGHEAYKEALLYYASVKMAAKIGDPDAKSIQEDLGKRFINQSRGKKPKENKM